MWPRANRLYVCSDSDESRAAGNWPVVNPVIAQTSGTVTCEWATNPLVGISNYERMHSSSKSGIEQLKNFLLAEVHLQNAFVKSPPLPNEFRKLTLAYE